MVDFAQPPPPQFFQPSYAYGYSRLSSLYLRLTQLSKPALFPKLCSARCGLVFRKKKTDK
jgi:hypothetical protein